MASSNDSNRRTSGPLALILGLFGLMGMNAAQHQHARLAARLDAWAETPLTVLAVQAAASRQGLSTRSAPDMVKRAVLDCAIAASNRVRPYVPCFLLLSLALAAYPRLQRRFGSLRHWPRVGLLSAGLVTLTTASGLLFGTPATWYVPFQLLCGLLLAPNLLVGIGCLVLAFARPWSSKQLQHGPAFKTPEREGKCLELGIADHRILPRHSHWLADGGGPIGIPFNRLSCGITILGEKGSGKTRLLFAIHDAIRQAHPDVPVLIHDPKGEWFRTYYGKSPKDIYFAPHFSGSAAWSLWNDFVNVPELRHELIASTVYSHPMPNGSFWMDQAVDLLDSLIDDTSFENSVCDLAEYPKKHADDKFALSVFGTARLAFLDLAKVQLMGKALGPDKPARSIKDFLAHKGRIFLLNDPACATQQNGAFSLFLSAFLLRALSMEDVPAGTLRAVAIVDEALTFNLPPDVERRIYAMCRSKGICIITGAQRLPDARRDERAEWETAEYILAMKVMHQESQRALSQRAGGLSFRETLNGKSTNTAGPSRSQNDHDTRIEAIPPEHFGRLAPREFILFHDRGLVSGRSIDVKHQPQPETKFPSFDKRTDVREVAVDLLGGVTDEAAKTTGPADAGSALQNGI